MKFLAAVMTLTLATSAIAMMEPNDAEVASTMVTINDGEIKMSELAQERASSAKVKDFAAMMIKEHQANRKEALNLAKKNNLESKQTENIMKMKEETNKKFAELSKLKGKEFDEAYMEAMVENHKKARLKIDQELEPFAKNTELKTMLMATQKKVEAHLEHAQKIESSL